MASKASYGPEMSTDRGGGSTLLCSQSRCPFSSIVARSRHRRRRRRLRRRRRRRVRGRWQARRGGANARRRKYWVYFEILFRCVGRATLLHAPRHAHASYPRARNLTHSSLNSTFFPRVDAFAFFPGVIDTLIFFRPEAPRITAARSVSGCLSIHLLESCFEPRESLIFQSTLAKYFYPTLRLLHSSRARYLSCFKRSVIGDARTRRSLPFKFHEPTLFRSRQRPSSSVRSCNCARMNVRN